MSRLLQVLISGVLAAHTLNPEIWNHRQLREYFYKSAHIHVYRHCKNFYLYNSAIWNDRAYIVSWTCLQLRRHAKKWSTCQMNPFGLEPSYFTIRPGCSEPIQVSISVKMKDTANCASRGSYGVHQGRIAAYGAEIISHCKFSAPAGVTYTFFLIAENIQRPKPKTINYLCLRHASGGKVYEGNSGREVICKNSILI